MVNRTKVWLHNMRYEIKVFLRKIGRLVRKHLVKVEEILNKKISKFHLGQTMNSNESEKLLLLNEKHTDQLTEQTKTRQKKFSDFILNKKSKHTFSFDTPLEQKEING